LLNNNTVFGFAGVATVDGGDVTAAPPGVDPVAVAVFRTEPASMSACVNVYVAVQSMSCVGANDPPGQLTDDNAPDPVNVPSSTPTFFTVTFPVFVIR
jgi:hypothetical protein